MRFGKWLIPGTGYRVLPNSFHSEEWLARSRQWPASSSAAFCWLHRYNPRVCKYPSTWSLIAVPCCICVAPDCVPWHFHVLLRLNLAIGLRGSHAGPYSLQSGKYGWGSWVQAQLFARVLVAGKWLCILEPKYFALNLVLALCGYVHIDKYSFMQQIKSCAKYDSQTFVWGTMVFLEILFILRCLCVSVSVAHVSRTQVLQRAESSGLWSWSCR